MYYTLSIVLLLVVATTALQCNELTKCNPCRDAIDDSGGPCNWCVDTCIPQGRGCSEFTPCSGGGGGSGSDGLSSGETAAVVIVVLIVCCCILASVGVCVAAAVFLIRRAKK